MTYLRTSPDEWANSTGNGREVSENYWRKQARMIFEAHSAVNTVEVVFTGCKTDSQFLKRGQKQSPPGVYVVLASTPGGSWGKARRDFMPEMLTKAKGIQ